MSARPHILLPLLLLILLVCAGWSYTLLADARDDAVSAAEDEAECKRLLARIASLRDKPALAGVRELQVTELTARIENAATTANCPPNSIIRIDPEPARRVGDSPYLEKPTQLLLRNLTLRQALLFLHTLSAADPGLRLASTRLSAPPGDEAFDRWQLECTLTYLIYSPRADTAADTAAAARDAS